MYIQREFVLLLPLIIIKMATGYNTGVKSIGEIVPREDFSLAVGKDLILYCTISKSYTKTFHPSDIKWYSAETSWEKFSTVVNESTVQLRIPNISKSHPTGYSCKLNTTEELSDVSRRDVKIGDPPSASNFNCISVELINMTCTWDSSPNDNQTSWILNGTGVEWKECEIDKNNTRISINETRCPYIAQLPIQDNYTLGERTRQGNLNQTRNNSSGSSQYIVLPVCNDTKRFSGHKKGCIYASNNYFDRTKRNYNFTLEGTNSMGNFSQNYNIDLHKRVVPPEPQDLEIVELPNVLLFNWSPPDLLTNFYIHASYHLQYRSQWNNTWTTLLMSNSTTCNLDNIIANTKYEIRVQCRPELAADSDDVWGPFASKNFTTQSKTPTSAPIIAPGCFQVIDQSAANVNRNITVYWTAIPEIQQNGSNFHYVINVDKIGEHHSSVTKTNRSFVNIGNLEMEESYEVKIFSVNEQGKSKDHAKITIPKTSEKLQFPQDLTVLSDDNIDYEILWRPPKQSQLTNGYTIFWCYNYKNTTCESDLSWTTANASASTMNWTLPKAGKELRFAISSNSWNSSSGLKWAECAPKRRDEDMFELEEVKLRESESNNVAMYLKAKCNFGIIDKFLFHDTESNSRESCIENIKIPHKLNATMDQNATGSKEFLLKLKDHLKSFTWYRFSISSLSRGRRSNWQHRCVQTGRISDNEMSDGIVTLIVISSVVCVAVIVVLLLKTWKRVHKVWMKLYRPPIRMPGAMEKCGKAGNGSSFVIDGSTEKSRYIANIKSCKAEMSVPHSSPMPKPRMEDCHSTGKESLSSTTTNQTRLSCDSTADQDVFMRDSECDESSSIDETMESRTHADLNQQVRYPAQHGEYQSAEPLFKKATTKLIPGYTPIAMVDCESGYGSGGQNGTKDKYDNPLANQKTVIERMTDVDLENQSPYFVFQVPKNHSVTEPSVVPSTDLEPAPWTAYSVLSTLENSNNDSSDKLTNCVPQSNISDCCGAEGYVKLDNIDINNDDPGCTMLPEASTAYVDGGIYCDNGYDPC